MQLHYTLNELEELELKYKDNHEVLQMVLWIKDRLHDYPAYPSAEDQED